MALCKRCNAQDKEVQGVQKLVPYKIVEGQDGAAWVESQGNKMSPSQVSETACHHAMPPYAMTTAVVVSSPLWPEI